MDKCKSSFCAITGGREFEPYKSPDSLTEQWCSACIRLQRQTTYMAAATADMIRNIWQEYEHTNLPREVKLFLKQYTIEILKQLGAEL